MPVQTQTITVPVSIAAAATDEIYVAQPLPGTWRLTGVYFAPGTAVAVDASNYLTSTITSNDGAAGSDVAVASHTTNSSGGTALALKTSIAITLTVGDGLELAQGEQLKIAKTEAGTGAALDGTYSFALEKVRA